MSHYVGLVLGPDFEGQLARYDENLEVEPYREDEDVDLQNIRSYAADLHRDYSLWVANGRPEPSGAIGGQDYWRHRSFRNIEAGTVPPVTATDEALVSWYYDGELQRDAAGWFRMSTRNPQGEWDYYRLGGRWAGFLILKDGASGTRGEPVRDWDTPTDYPLGNRADQALHGDVDWAATEAFWLDRWKASVDDAEFGTYTLVAEGVWRSRRTWNRATGKFEDHPDWYGFWRQMVLNAPDDMLVSIIDYHS